MADVSARVRRRIRGDFPHHEDRVTSALAGLVEGVVVDAERLQVAALLVAQGDLRRLDEAVALGRTDWRDLLVAADLADEGWQDRVETELSPAPDGHAWAERRGRRPD